MSLIQTIIDFFLRKPSEKKPHELAPGIPKPSWILAGILEIRLLEYPEKIEKYDPWPRPHMYSDRYKKVWKHENVKITVSTEDRFPRLVSIEFDDKYFEFDSEEKVKITEAFTKAMKLQQEKENQRKFYEKENRAVDLIAQMFSEKQLVSNTNQQYVINENYIKCLPNMQRLLK